MERLTPDGFSAIQNELREDYQKALARLEEALQEDLAKGSIVVDGAIIFHC